MVSNNMPSSSSSSREMTVDLGQKDHRKRRRNRTRVSCLNCYASKRKCDRKRPCTRCIKHGLTGLCVYELDDPNARDRSHLDENTRLKYRIAELESTIREINNRPHPRWTAPGGVEHDPGLLRRGPSRRVKANYVRSSSIDAFFTDIADAEDENIKVKVEQDPFIPEFTPSDRGSVPGPSYSPYGSPLTPLSSLSPDSPTSVSAPYTISSTSSTPPGNGLPASHISAPFTFDDGPYADMTEKRPLLSSFVQTSGPGMGDHSCRSLKVLAPEAHSPASTASSEEGPPLASISQTRREPRTPPSSLSIPGHSRSPTSFPEHPNHRSTGTQITPVSSLPPSRSSSVIPSVPPPPSSDIKKDESMCRCLIDPTVYNPLVFFASALRTSREALEVLHPPTSNCVLFRRIMELDEHIFSASPPTPPTSPKVWPIHDFGGSVTHTGIEPAFTPSSPTPHAHDSLVRHPHSYSLPLYSQPSSASPSIHQHFEPAQHVHAYESDAFTYFSDSPAYHGWM